MALSSSTVWEVRTGGSDTANGGGFVTGASGTDYSQQNSPQYSLTGLTSSGAGNVILTASASSDMVGNILRVTAGTNFTVGWFQITAVSVGVSITCSTNSAGTAVTTGAGASGTAAVGGALKTPGIAASQMTVAGMVCYIKNEGTIFSITSATANVAGGVVGATAAPSLMIGYQTNRTPVNTDAAPTLQLNVSTATMLLGNSAVSINLICDGNAQTSAKLTNGATLIGCVIKNFNTASTSSVNAIGCLITGNSAFVVISGFMMFCELTANTATPAAPSFAVACISYGNTGATTRGMQVQAIAIGCTFVGNGSDGVLIGSTGVHYVGNCIFQSNGGFGINGNSVNLMLGNNNAFFGNTSGQMSGTAPATYNLNPITYSGDAFTNTAGSVYSLNNLAGQGAALRATALPSLFPAGLTPNFLDAGCVQHQDSGGGASGMLFIPNMQGT